MNDFEDFPEYKRAMAVIEKFALENKPLFDTISKIGNNIRNIQPEALQKAQKMTDIINAQLPILKISQEMQSYIEEAKDSERLSARDFEEKYGEEVSICKDLGRSGWVISEYSNPRIIKEWYRSLQNGNEEIANFFMKDDNQFLSKICTKLESIYIENPYKLYYLKGIEAFGIDDYMTAAMYLVALLEVRINKLIQFNVRTYKEKYSYVGFEKRKTKDFERMDSFFTKRFYFLNVYPSIIEYLNRMFVDGEYTFENDKEPPYINRNWLLHGRMSRNIEKFECIQILNTLSVFEFAFGQ